MIFVDEDGECEYSPYPPHHSIDLDPVVPDPHILTSLVDGCFRADYIRAALDPEERGRLIESASYAIEPLQVSTIAVRGVSGLVFGAPLAYVMDKHLTVVRKKDGSHSCYAVEGYLPGPLERWVIVDDLISTGATIEYILRGLEYAPGWLGVYLYNLDKFYDLIALEKFSHDVGGIVGRYRGKTNALHTWN